MKSILIASLFAISATIYGLEPNEFEIDSLNKEQFNEVFCSCKDYIIFKFKEGSTFPLKIKVGGEILEYEGVESPGFFKVKQPFYLYVHLPRDFDPEQIEDKESASLVLSKCSFLFSTDKTDWKTLNEFISGNLSAAIFGEYPDEACVELNLDLNLKKENNS